MDGFDENQELKSELYPYSDDDRFKFLRTKFGSKITETFLQLSFLGGNPEIISECLNHQKLDWECMKYAIVSHNIDLVTFLMNEQIFRSIYINAGFIIILNLF